METKDIEISKIKVLENIRQSGNTEDLSQLMQSIKDNGLLQQIGVIQQGKEYVLVWGFRRMTACKKLGWKSIQAVVIDNENMTEQEFLLLNAIENIQRKDISPVELGRICNQLRKTMGLKEIAVKLSITKSRVESALEIYNNLPEEIQNKVKVFDNSAESKDGKVSLTTAKYISRLRGLNKEQKLEIFELARKEGLNLIDCQTLGGLYVFHKDLKKAFKKLKEYTSINPSIIVKKSVKDKMLKDYNGLNAWTQAAVIKEYGKGSAVQRTY